MALNINEDEARAILAEVEASLGDALEGARAQLAKADDEKSASASPASASASPEGSPESSASGSPGGDAPPMGDPSADPSAPPASPSADPSAPPMDPSAAPAGAPGADPAAGGEDLESKLMALPEDQLRHLYMAAKQAVFARMGSADPSASAGAPPAPPMDPAASASAPPAGPPAASPSPSPAGPPPMPPMGKGEMKASPANGGGKTSAIKIGKSETQESDLMKAEDKKQLEDLKLQVEGLTKALTIMAGAPMRKAITSVAHLAKPGSEAPSKAAGLSKAEVTAKLKEVCGKAETSTKDRRLVNDFYAGKVNVDGIAHLLQ